jgi:hypothetical protein
MKVTESYCETSARHSSLKHFSAHAARELNSEASLFNRNRTQFARLASHCCAPCTRFYEIFLKKKKTVSKIELKIFYEVKQTLVIQSLILTRG